MDENPGKETKKSIFSRDENNRNKLNNTYCDDNKGNFVNNRN